MKDLTLQEKRDYLVKTITQMKRDTENDYSITMNYLSEDKEFVIRVKTTEKLDIKAILKYKQVYEVYDKYREELIKLNKDIKSELKENVVVSLYLYNLDESDPLMLIQDGKIMTDIID